jgi:hypothetical protein
MPFPIIAAHVSPVRLARLVTAYEGLQAGVAAGSIANASYVDFKDAASRTIDAAWDAIRPVRSDLYTSSGLVVFLRGLKREGFTDFAAEIKPVVKALVALKGKTVKRAQALAAAKAALPRVPKADVFTAETLFNQVAEPLKDALRANRTGYWNDLLTVLRNADPKLLTWRGLRDTLFPNQPSMRSDACRLLGDDGGIPGAVNTWITQTVKRKADDTYARFIAKQTGKLAGILKGRQVEKAEGQVYGNLTGHVRIVIAGGTRFEMRFSIVGAHSPLGAWFYRFPTTFHDVFDCDGNKVSVPSEAKLAEVL